MMALFGLWLQSPILKLEIAYSAFTFSVSELVQNNLDYLSREYPLISDSELYNGAVLTCVVQCTAPIFCTE